MNKTNLINEIKTKLSLKDKVELYKFLHGEVSKAGRKGDTELAHINTFESRILKMLGGSGSINPNSGLKEYFGGGVLFLSELEINQSYGVHSSMPINSMF